MLTLLEVHKYFNLLHADASPKSNLYYLLLSSILDDAIEY